MFLKSVQCRGITIKTNIITTAERRNKDKKMSDVIWLLFLFAAQLQPHKDLAPTAINHCPLLDARAGDHCRRYAIMMVPKQKQSNQWQDESAMATAAPSHLNGSWARMPII